jgi:hypothetical protein
MGGGAARAGALQNAVAKMPATKIFFMVAPESDWKATRPGPRFIVLSGMTYLLGLLPVLLDFQSPLQLCNFSARYHFDVGMKRTDLGLKRTR